MKTQFLCLGVLSGLSTVLTGCATEPFVPKALNENAKGISTVRSTPYGCKVLGEIEGKDEKKSIAGGIIIGGTLLSMREGAMNDLRNNAVEVVGNSKKRTVLKVISEAAFCAQGYKCPNQEIEIQNIHSYLVKGEIFECGDK